jgi:hypothetical protein
MAVGRSKRRTSALASSNHSNDRATLLLEREVFLLKLELGQHFVHRNAFAAALSKPRLAPVKTAAIFVSDRFIVERVPVGVPA